MSGDYDRNGLEEFEKFLVTLFPFEDFFRSIRVV